MDLINLKTLSTNEKSAVLKTTAGLQWLEELLLEGNSLSKIADMLEVEPSILYRWKNIYPDIKEVVAPYLRARKTEPIEDLSQPLNYRIIYAYDELRPNIKGFIWDEFLTAEEAWDNPFIDYYFSSFNNYDARKYREDYLAAIKSTGFYKLSNWYMLTYCSVTKKGLIKPQKPPA